MFKMLPNTILALNKWPKIFKISSKWQIFAKTGHTVQKWFTSNDSNKEDDQKGDEQTTFVRSHYLIISRRVIHRRVIELLETEITLNGNLKTHLSTVGLDWAIFESSWEQSSLQK